MDVLIADDRPDWMKKEDEVAVCRMHCSLFKKCSTRCGPECKRLGGDIIPKIRNQVSK